MRVLDRYVTQSVASIFLSTIIIFCLLYVLIDIASNLDDLIKQKAPLAAIVQYYSSFLPIMFVQTSPIACLIATLFTYSNLNNNNEIIVLRTSGLNFWQIAKPAICLGIVISAFIFLVNEKFVPESESKSEKIKAEKMAAVPAKGKRGKRPKIKNLTFYGLKNRLYFVDKFDANTYELEGLTIIGFDKKQNIKEKIVALRGEWTGIAWKLYNCQISTFNLGNIRTPDKVRVYQEKIVDIKETPQDFLRQRLNVNSMNIRQLSDYIHRFSNSGAAKAINNLKVDLYQKYAYPFGNLVIVLVGLPLAMMTGRRKALTFTSLGIAIAIGFFYYVCNAVGLALGKGGLFPPMLSAWLAPMIFALVAAYMIKVKFQ